MIAEGSIAERKHSVVHAVPVQSARRMSERRVPGPVLDAATAVLLHDRPHGSVLTGADIARRSLVDKSFVVIGEMQKIACKRESQRFSVGKSEPESFRAVYLIDERLGKDEAVYRKRRITRVYLARRRLCVVPKIRAVAFERRHGKPFGETPRESDFASVIEHLFGVFGEIILAHFISKAEVIHVQASAFHFPFGIRGAMNAEAPEIIRGKFQIECPLSAQRQGVVHLFFIDPGKLIMRGLARKRRFVIEENHNRIARSKILIPPIVGTYVSIIESKDKIVRSVAVDRVDGVP